MFTRVISSIEKKSIEGHKLFTITRFLVWVIWILEILEISNSTTKRLAVQSMILFFLVFLWHLKIFSQVSYTTDAFIYTLCRSSNKPNNLKKVWWGRRRVVADGLTNDCDNAAHVVSFSWYFEQKRSASLCGEFTHISLFRLGIQWSVLSGSSTPF